MNLNDKTDKTEKYLKQIKFFAKINENDKVILMLDKIDKLDMKTEMITPFIDAMKQLFRNKDKIVEKKASKLINKWTTNNNNNNNHNNNNNNIIIDDSKNILNKFPIDNDTRSLKESVLSSLENELKRKSISTSEDLKPQKVRKTDKTLKRSIKNQSSSSAPPSADIQPHQEIIGISFFDAIKKKTSQTSVFTNVSKQQKNNPDGESEEKEYPESVVEKMERFCEMFEEWKRKQNFALVGSQNGGRISTTTKKKKVVELSLVEKFRESLQMCINDVECIDGMPYDILKPVLYQLSTSQLERFESFNPDVINQNGDLWKKHVLAKCPKQSNENLGWREIWMKYCEKSKASVKRSFVKSIKLIPECSKKLSESQKEQLKKNKSNHRPTFVPFNKPEVSSREELLRKLKKLSRR